MNIEGVSRSGGNRLGGVLLQVFLFLFFFVHYETIGVTGTLHSWVLVLGLLVTIPPLVGRVAAAGGRLPLDYLAVGVIALIVVLGSVATLGGVTLSQVQAYLLSLAGYVFVRENMPAVPVSRFFSIVLLYLVVNSLLIVLQFVTGEFYVAGYLAAGEPPLMIPSGVSDGPTKNGMLQALALGITVAAAVAERGPRRVTLLLIAILGVVALIMSASRAGVVAFAGALLIAGLLAVPARRARLRRRRGSAVVAVVVVTALLVGVVQLIQKLPALAQRLDGNYAAGVLAYKWALDQNEDLSRASSFGTRWHHMSMAWDQILSNPFQPLSVGFGAGRFEARNGLNMHNSYVEVLYEFGIYGLAALLFLTLHVVRRALIRGPPDIVIPLVTGLASVMVFMAFHDVLRGRIFWTPLAILAAVAYSHSAHAAGERPPARSAGLAGGMAL